MNSDYHIKQVQGVQFQNIQEVASKKLLGLPSIDQAGTEQAQKNPSLTQEAKQKLRELATSAVKFVTGMSPEQIKGTKFASPLVFLGVGAKLEDNKFPTPGHLTEKGLGTLGNLGEIAATCIQRATQKAQQPPPKYENPIPKAEKKNAFAVSSNVVNQLVNMPDEQLHKTDLTKLPAELLNVFLETGVNRISHQQINDLLQADGNAIRQPDGSLKGNHPLYDKIRATHTAAMQERLDKETPKT